MIVEGANGPITSEADEAQGTERYFANSES